MIKTILFFMGYAKVPLEIVLMAIAIKTESKRDKPNMIRIYEMAQALETWGRSARLCNKDKIKENFPNEA